MRRGSFLAVFLLAASVAALWWHARNDGGPAGLIIRLSYTPRKQRKQILASDGTWKASKTAAKGWQQLDFDEKGWSPAKVLGEYGKVGPWHNLAAGPGSDPKRRFT